ncbi:hypothetical protein YC2023_045148 [Brassica napus]
MPPRTSVLKGCFWVLMLPSGCFWPRLVHMRAVCSVHTGRLWLSFSRHRTSVSTHRTSVAVLQHTHDVRGLPSVHVCGLPISTHISTLGLSVDYPSYTYQHAGPSHGLSVTHISMLALPVDCCPCTDFGQLMHHVSTHISMLALPVNYSCTDLDMSSSFDGLDCPSPPSVLMGKRTEGMLLGFNAPVRMLLAETWGGSNLSDKGLNLSGSWQQGHSATYNTPSRRADIEGSKSNVAMNAWLPQASYPCESNELLPFVPHEISVLVELILGHLRYLLTDVPPQPNYPPDNVLRPDRPAEASLGSKRRGCYPASDSRRSSFPADSAKPVPLAVVSLDSRQGHSELAVRRPGKAPERAVPSPSPGRHEAVRSRHVSSSSSPPTVDGFGTGTPEPSPQSQSFSRSYGSILPTSLAYIVPSTRGCSPWRPDAVMSTTGRERHSVLRIFKGRWECTGHHATCGALPAAGPYLRLSRFQICTDGRSARARALGFAATAAPSYSSRPGSCSDSRVSAQLGTVTRLPVHPASPVLLTKNGPLGALDPVGWLNKAAIPSYLFKYRCGPPPEFPLDSPRSGIVHHLSGPEMHAHTRTLLRRSMSVGCAPVRDPANQLHCALRVYSPVDSHTCQTPWSVFQDGSNGEPTGRRPEHADAEARPLDGIYRPIGAAFPNNPTRRQRLVVRQDVPPQPNSPPDNVLRPDRPAEASLGSKRRGCYPASDSRIGLESSSTGSSFPADSAKPVPLAVVSLDRRQGHSELAVRRPGKAPERAVPSPSPGRHEVVRSRHVSSSSRPPTVDGGCSPWRPDAVMSTTGRERHSVLQIFEGRRECTEHHATCGALPAAGPYLRLSRFQGGQAICTDGRSARARALGFAATAAPSYSSRPGSCPDGRVSAQLGTETRLPVHPASPVLLTKNGPLGALDSVGWLNKAAILSSYPEGNFGGNQLLDGSISLSPLYPGMLTLEPFSEDQGRSAVHPSNREPTGRRLEHADAEARPLDGIYRQIGAAFPNNPTRRQRLVVRQGPGTMGLSPSLAPLSRELGPGPSLRTLLQTTIRTPKTSNFQAGLFPVRPPLLWESLLVSFPPLIDILKLSG